MNLVVPHGNFGGGWRRFANCRDNLVGRRFWRFRTDSRKERRFLNASKHPSNFFAWPSKKFSFRSMLEEFPNRPEKKIGDFIEKRKVERHSKSWKSTVLVWRLKADLSWESI